MTAVAHAVRLARIDARRMVRKHADWGSGTGIASILVFAVMTVGLTLGGGYLASVLGEALVAGELEIDPASAMSAARGLVAVFGLIGIVVVAVRAVGQRGTLDNAEGVLTIVPTREAVLGVLLAEYVYVLLWLGGPALGIGIGGALGTGSIWPVVGVPFGIAVLGLAVVAVGYPLGLAVRHVITRFAFVARHRGALIVVVFVAYIALVASGSLNAAVVALFEPMQTSPAGWFADILLLGVPELGATAIRAAGAVGLAAGLAAVGVAGGTRAATAHWFSDPVLAGEEESEADAAPVRDTRFDLSAVEGRVPLPAPTVALVALAWRRAIRSPIKLLYAAYPLLLVVGVFADIVQTGRIPGYLPVGVLVFVAWAAGVLFTLNPLGDQGAVLPATILSRVDGRQFVGAHMLASLVVAVPLGTLATGVIALVSPLAVSTAAVLVAATPLVLIAASATSVGIGMAFPRFEAVNVTRSMKAVVPSLVSFVLFTLYLVTTVAAAVTVDSEVARAIGAALLNAVLPFGLAVAPETLFVVAAVALAALVVVPAVSYRYAVGAFDDYALA